jgi:dihydrofolate reductase
MKAPGCVVVHSMEEAYLAAGNAEEVAIIGGSGVFEAALPVADRIYLTEVEGEVEGDVLFPPFDRSGWRETELERHLPDARTRVPLPNPPPGKKGPGLAERPVALDARVTFRPPRRRDRT